jgi:hypothetical protein
MRQRLRDSLVLMRTRAYAPLMHRFDLIDTRLTAVESRLADVESQIQIEAARSSTVNGRAIRASETEARLSKRIQAIERLLGAAEADP